jgi:hypothetical protein
MKLTRKSNKHNKSKNINKTKKNKLHFKNLKLYIPKEIRRLLNLDPPRINNNKILTSLNMLTVSKNSTAQSYINNAMLELYNFNQIEACNNFIMAALYDTNCAFAYWGASYSVQLNINHIIISKNILKFSVESLKRAIILKSNKSTLPVVKDLIDALYNRTVIPNHSIDAPANTKPSYTQIEAMMLQYNKDMESVYKKYSNTNENIDVLYAASIMTIHPWKWWPQESMYDTYIKSAVKPLPYIKSAYHVLQKVLHHSPYHIGALHYFVHVTEESPRPEVALFAANNLKKLTNNVPLGHIVHVPSHIYSRIGAYMDSITANISAIESDNNYLKYKIKATGRKQINSYYIIEYISHNLHFLIVDAQRMGNIAYCEKYLPILEKHVHKFIDIKGGKNLFLEHFLTVKCQVYLRFGMYKKIIQLSRPQPLYLLWSAVDSFTRLVAYCKLGDQKSAYAEYIIFKEVNNKFIKEAPKETCRCGCSKRHGGVCNPNYGLNKYTYFRKLNIPYDSDDNYDNDQPACCVGKLRDTVYTSPTPGGITSPTGYASDATNPHISVSPALLFAASGTLTVNNTVLLAQIRETLCHAYIEWFFGGHQDIALEYFKKATKQYEDLQYDEPSAYQSDVHHIYAFALYMSKKYKDALYIIDRGEIPYPNQLNAAFIKMLIYKKIGTKQDIETSKIKYNKLQVLADYTPILHDF